MHTQIHWLLEEIDQRNNELSRLIDNPEEANQQVNPRPFLSSDQFKITYKNRIELEREQYVGQLREILTRYDLGLRSNRPTPLEDTTGNKYVAFLDILGFSNIVNNNSQEEMNSLMNFIRQNVQMSLTSEELGKTKFKLQHYGFVPDLSDTTVNVILLSDTLVFWTKDDSVESFYTLVKMVNILLGLETYYYSIGLRGAIAIGELGYTGSELNTKVSVLNFSTAYGKAIVDAYQYEKSQEWIGCVVTDEAVENFTSKAPNQEMAEELFNKLLIRYKVPYKQNLVNQGENFVVRWPRGWRANEDRQHLVNCFTRHQKLDEIPSDPSVQGKFENTLAFIAHVEQVSKAEHSDS